MVLDDVPVYRDLVDPSIDYPLHKLLEYSISRVFRLLLVIPSPFVTLALHFSGGREDYLRHHTALNATPVTLLPFQATPFLRIGSIPLFQKLFPHPREIVKPWHDATIRPRHDSETCGDLEILAIISYR